MTVVALEAGKRPKEEEELWTSESLLDHILLNLCQTKETVINENNRSITVRKYYRQARELMKWIPIARLPSNEFIINVSDLTPSVRNEIDSISKAPSTLRYVLTQAVGRIFENLDFDYYHLSVARNLRVRLEV